MSLKQQLYERGVQHVRRFCDVNHIECPSIMAYAKPDWAFKHCAYYRRRQIHICIDLCASPCDGGWSRNWNWPGGVTDREPYGVLAHELGHHADTITGNKRGNYSSDYSSRVREASGEKPITSYCPNDGEWFAEMFRLFVTNHALLRELRPIAYDLLCGVWTPITSDDWREALGTCPQQITYTCIKKGAL